MKGLVLFSLLAFAELASAQNMRSWVSSTGLDTNPCTRTAPCANFQRAHDKTNAGGEINCVDSGDFGLVTVNKSLTIDCRGTFGSIFVPTDGIGIFVAGTPIGTDTVIIRNLSVNGGGRGGEGIINVFAKTVHLENLRISGVNGPCVEASTGYATTLLTVHNATISECGTGIEVDSSNDVSVAHINKTRVLNTGTGVGDSDGGRVTLRESTIYFNQVGIGQHAGADNPTLTTAIIVNSTLGYSSVAALQGFPNAFDYLVALGNTFVNDIVAFNPNGGRIFTGGDNNNSGSTPGTANGGTVPKI